mmetsp:Transcript_2940/g.5419  ORF Transcript_2940/g.5419 Transcript_2940/m.5419 type:complete len:391 (-) Transcript_2940:206-1378(-)
MLVGVAEVVVEVVVLRGAAPSRTCLVLHLAEVVEVDALLGGDHPDLGHALLRQRTGLGQHERALVPALQRVSDISHKLPVGALTDDVVVLPERQSERLSGGVHRRLRVRRVHKHLLGEVVLVVVHVRRLGGGVPREGVGRKRRLHRNDGWTAHARKAERRVHAPLPPALLTHSEAILLALEAVVALVESKHLNPVSLERVDIEIRDFLGGVGAIVEPAKKLRIFGKVEAFLALQRTSEEVGDLVIAKGSKAPRRARRVPAAPRDARHALAAVCALGARFEGGAASAVEREARAIDRHAVALAPRQARRKICEPSPGVLDGCKQDRGPVARRASGFFQLRWNRGRCINRSWHYQRGSCKNECSKGTLHTEAACTPRHGGAVPLLVGSVAMH